jgi:Cof subfamily protein (haloacid dehalogenase superfamily)
MYKILALDLDGTLLNEEHRITKKAEEGIEKLKDIGVKIILVSGREAGSVVTYSKELGLNECIVGFNGGIVTNNSGEKILFQRNIDEKVVKHVIESCEEKGLYNILFVHNNLYVSNYDDERYELFKKYTTSEIYAVGDLMEFVIENRLFAKMGKMLQVGTYEELVDFKKGIDDIYSDKVNSQFSLPFFLEIYNSNVSKGRALKEIAENYNIDREDIIAIGDGENDISMIKYAGVGIAMENAPLHVRKEADFVTKSNFEEGVNYAIEKFWNV